MDNSRSDYEFNIQTEGGGGCRACTFFSEGKISDFYRCKFSGQKPQSHTKKIKRFFVEKKIALPPPQNDVILCMITYFRYQCLNKFVFIWREDSREHMVLILFGNSEIGAHIRGNLCYFFWLRHLIRSKGVTNRFIWSICLHACATCFE